MYFIGDPHGKWHKLEQAIKYKCSSKSEKIVLLGDIGIGFAGHPYPETFDSRVSFIRGNHDYNKACKEHSQYIGDYKYDKENRILYISGAFSIDRAWRTEGVDWWSDEELPMRTFYEIIDKVDSEEWNPKTIVSHTCPESIVKLLHGENRYPNRTEQALQRILDLSWPDLWVFGHHHKSFDKEVDGTRFVGLNELEVRPLDTSL